jgi:hypothetical protein
VRTKYWFFSALHLSRQNREGSIWLALGTEIAPDEFNSDGGIA